MKAVGALPWKRLQTHTTALLVCDMQEGFKSLIHRMDYVTDRCAYLSKFAKVHDYNQENVKGLI